MKRKFEVMLECPSYSNMVIIGKEIAEAVQRIDNMGYGVIVREVRTAGWTTWKEERDLAKQF